MQGSFIQGFACLPHARGGVSWIAGLALMRVKSSPRTWGCFQGEDVIVDLDRVFPAHVGVFLCSRGVGCGRPRLPHARGGVSDGIT